MQPQDKVEMLYNSNQLKWYIIRILKNQHDSTTSPFYKKYGKYRDSKAGQGIPELPDASTEYDLERDKIEQEVLKELSSHTGQIDFYEKAIFKEYVEVGSARRVSILTKIDIRSVTKAVNNVKQKINNKWDNPYK